MGYASTSADFGLLVEVAGIEPASRNASGREHYVCSRIRASDGCAFFVKNTKPGESFNCGPG